jgi:hypothetical protein
MNDKNFSFTLLSTLKICGIEMNMENLVQLVSQLSDELSSLTKWGKIFITKLRDLRMREWKLMRWKRSFSSHHKWWQKWTFDIWKSFFFFTSFPNFHFASFFVSHHKIYVTPWWWLCSYSFTFWRCYRQSQYLMRTRKCERFSFPWIRKLCTVHTQYTM